MRTLAIDIETYSSEDLLKTGVYRYAEADDFEILLLAYAYDDEPVRIIDLASGDIIPPQLRRDILGHHVDGGGDVICSAFNANFERVCLSRHFGSTGFIAPDHWICSAVKSRYAGLPGHLDGAAKALGLEQQKDAAGKRLIQYFSKPCKPTKVNGGRTRNLPEHDAQKWQQFKDYCVQDVEVERAVSKALAKIRVPQSEWDLWHVDQRINDRGVRVDMDLVNNALRINNSYTDFLKDQMRILTEVQNPNSLPQLKAWVERRMGRKIDTLDKNAVPLLLEETDDQEVAAVLQIRRELGKTSTSKYEAVARSVCSDERVRGLLMFYGASRTGRWAGRLVQVQNLPQNKIEDLDLARSLVRRGEEELLWLLYSSTPVILSQLIRTAFIASPGKKLVISDFSAIEARVIAWLAGEGWRLDVFNTHGKIYEASASKMFGVPIEKVDKSLRAKGKVAELALGYGGALGALKQMGGDKMGLSDEDMKGIVTMWRSENPAIVQLWEDLEEAALRVIQERGLKSVETHGLKIFSWRGGMYIKLPSGRVLSYPRAGLTKNRFGMTSISYYGLRTTGGYGEIETYGGKLTENVVQAIARDCLAVAMMRMDAAGYEIVMHVHDEVIIDGYAGDLERVNAIMGETIEWAPGLPLKGAGFETDYYMKD